MSKSYILKVCLFATGLSGIVAEYILATLASYFIGDSVFQWAMIVSIMLFAMGLGSRFSKFFESGLLQKFIYIEFALSLLVAFSSLLAYSATSYTIYSGFIIYFLSIVIGLLIGMEIPLVVRINDEFESLRINVASVMEKDYYGSLVGGLFFAFVGLPYLGLTYTPFVLGFINFIVAFLLFGILYKHIAANLQKQIAVIAFVIFVSLSAGIFIAKPVILHGEQKKYKDKVIFSQQSKYQKIVITQWKNDYWLFLNGNQQLSSLDEVMYHEPLVHPAVKLSKKAEKVLILGGGDGCAARELLKYPDIKSIKLVDLDPEMTKLSAKHQVLKKLNKNSMNNEKVKITNADGYAFIEKDTNFYDVIIIDLPDPKTVELGRLYSHEFYSLCYKRLRQNGVIITQAGSPYYATKAFLCIDKTMQSAGFTTALLHNQIVTLGEWGWVIGLKTNFDINLKNVLRTFTYENVATEWLNNEAMQLMTSFGKEIYPFPAMKDSVQINFIHDPVLYHYYLKGNWELYN
ncbi:MAG: spermidine synthase [Bacteroidia bacterium]|nr:MAG: spermidine synthase [Bacteroidia bacterium]